MRKYLEFIGNIGLFALRAARRVLVRPFEFQMILRQIEVAGWKSLPLVLASGFALGLVGGYLAERASSDLSVQLYISRAFHNVSWVAFIPPTLKTAIFGAVIGLISSYLGYTTDEGAEGVGRAATNSVVISSLAIILIDVVLVKAIFFLFPETAI